ncbi:MAG: hypothetical protein ACT4PT_04565 [Methanobacteriota archaeon]
MATSRTAADGFDPNSYRAVLRATVSSPRNLLALGLSLLVVTAVASAAVTITYNTASRQNITILAPPIVWSAGPDSSGNDYVASWVLSQNATYFNVTLRPLPEANVTWGNLSSIKSQAPTNKTVVVSGTSVVGYAKILDYKLEFYRWSNDQHVATLDLRQASPATSLGTLVPGDALYVKTYIKLDTGAYQSDLPGSVSLSLTIS